MCRPLGLVALETPSMCSTGIRVKKGPHLAVRDVIKHLPDLGGGFHRGGDGMGGGERVDLHGVEAFAQKEVILWEEGQVNEEVRKVEG